MNNTTKPSARPPRNHPSAEDRFAALDRPEAQAYIGAAPDVLGTEDGKPDNGQPAKAAGADQDVVSSANAVAIPLQPAENVWKPYNLRVRPSMHKNLSFIAKHSPKSMNEFINSALEDAVEKELQRLQRIIDLGLDKIE